MHNSGINMAQLQNKMKRRDMAFQFSFINSFVKSFKCLLTIFEANRRPFGGRRFSTNAYNSARVPPQYVDLVHMPLLNVFLVQICRTIETFSKCFRAYLRAQI